VHTSDPVTSDPVTSGALRALVRALLIATVSLPVLVWTAPAAAQGAPKAQQRGEGRRYLEAGKKAFAAKKYEEAAQLFGQSFKSDPKLTIALYNRAFALRKAQKYGDAAVAYRAFLQLLPEDLDALYGLAESERLAGENDSARQHYREYIAKEKREKRRGHVDRAREQLAGLGADVGPDLDGMFAQGLKLHREKKYAEAAAVFVKVYGLDDGRKDALYRQALALRRAGDLVEAKLAYRKFLKYVPKDADGIYGLAETERLSGNAPEAIRYFERYIEIEKRPSEAKYVERARQYIKLLRGVPKEEPAPAVAAAPAPVEPAPVEPAPVEPVPVASSPPAVEPPAAEPEPASPVEPAVPESPAVEEPAPLTLPSIPTIAGHGPSPSHAAVLGRALGVRKLVREGREALEGGDADRAHERFALAAAMAPDDEAVAAARDATALARTPRRASGMSADESLAALDTLLAEAESALTEGRAEAAIAAFQRARAAYPGSARPLFGLARAYELKGDTRGARHGYQLYIDSDAADVDADKVSDARWKLAQP